MGVALSGTTQITAIGISLAQRTRLFATGAWITAMANLFLNVILIPHWGALGAAAATFLSYGLLTGLYLIWSQRLHPIPLEKRKLLFSATSAIGVAAASAAVAAVEPSVLTVVMKTAALMLILAGGAALGIVDFSALGKLMMRNHKA
jgi:O-antigen/teichoic acid export membrane protein